MPALTTVNVGSNVTLLYGSQGSAGTPLTVINLDTANTVYVGNVSNLDPSGSNVIPLNPLSSISFDGSVSVYAITLGPQVRVAITPGGNSYSAGQLTITGPVTAEITGPVDANILGTASVAVTGTPNVNVVSGTLNATVTNATINVAGSVSLIPTIANITTLGTLSGASFSTMTPGASQTLMSLVDVSVYNSISISAYLNSANTITVGATLTSPLFVTWFDDLVTGIPVLQDEIDIWNANNTLPPAGFAGVAYITLPVRGRYLTIATKNVVTASNIAIQFFNAYGCPNIIPRIQCRQQAPPSLTATNGVIFPSFTSNLCGMLGSTGTSAIPNGSIYFMPMSLFTGQAEIYCLTSVAFGQNATLYAVIPSAGNNGLRLNQNNTTGVIDDGLSLNGTSVADAPIALPKCPTMLVFDNSSGAAQTVTCCLTAMDQA